MAVSNVVAVGSFSFVGPMLFLITVYGTAAGASDEPPMDAAVLAPAAASAVGNRDGYRALVRQEAARAGLPPDVADAVTEVESSYNPTAIGAAGEIGLMQVMPSTARLLGFTGTLEELAVPEVNIHYGVAYLAQAWRLANNDICTATMKYRAGHNETRFSYRSVDYCLKVRAKLVARGFPVVGEVPAATFGEPMGRGARALPGRGTGPNFDALNSHLRAIVSEAAASALRIR
jgi:soluble lytic murein transglycosylase-like protein